MLNSIQADTTPSIPCDTKQSGVCQIPDITTQVMDGLPLVQFLAHRVTSRTPLVDRDDLEQEGAIGLMEAGRRFRPSQGVRFRTFASRRITGAMWDALRRQAWPRMFRQLRRELEQARE